MKVYNILSHSFSLREPPCSSLSFSHHSHPQAKRCRSRGRFRNYPCRCLAQAQKSKNSTLQYQHPSASPNKQTKAAVAERYSIIFSGRWGRHHALYWSRFSNTSKNSGSCRFSKGRRPFLPLVHSEYRTCPICSKPNRFLNKC